MTATDTPAPPLGYHQGLPVTGASIEVRGTGSGLDKSLYLPDIDLEPGRYDVVFRCDLDKHRYELNPDGEWWTLVYLMKAEAATLPEVDQTAATALDTAETKIAERKSEQERRKREEQGQGELPLDDDGPRGGEPEQVGSALDDALQMAADADADLEGWSKQALTAEAKRLEIPGRSSMDADQLRDEIRRARRTEQEEADHE